MLKKGVINKKMYNARHKTNVTTLAPQEIIFGVTVVCVIVGAIGAGVFKHVGSFHHIVLLRGINVVAISVCEILSSNDIKRYFNLKIF